MRYNETNSDWLYQSLLKIVTPRLDICACDWSKSRHMAGTKSH